LSLASGVPAPKIVFVKDKEGKPEVAGPPEACGLVFSVTNTDGLAMTAVGRASILGLDAEPKGRRVEMRAVSRYFHPEEKLALAGLSDAAAMQNLLALWTLKEAFAKALGKGLSLSLAKTLFSVDPDGRVAVSFAPDLGQDPGAWTFTLFQPTPDHLAALAVRSPAKPAVRLLDLSGQPDLVEP
ncbi:MAG: 4'-phosphopantetheinyl transferase superfamily protein, partial [Thermodesulfobacteriota bacterium]